MKSIHLRSASVLVLLLLGTLVPGAAQTSGPFYAVEVASASSEKILQPLLDRLVGQEETARIEYQSGFHRLLVGRWSLRAEAEEALERLRQDHPTAILYVMTGALEGQEPPATTAPPPVRRPPTPPPPPRPVQDNVVIPEMIELEQRHEVQLRERSRLRHLGDEERLWKMLEEDRYAEAAEELDRLLTEDPDWRPPESLVALIEGFNRRRAIDQAVANGQWGRFRELARDYPQEFTCQRVDLLWSLAEAHARQGDHGEALEVYRRVVRSCEPQAVMPTLEKAAPHLGPQAMTQLVEDATPRVPEADRAALTERRYTAAVAELGKASSEENHATVLRWAERIEGDVVERRDADIAEAIGWSAYSLSKDTLATSWFTRALEWHPGFESAAFGLALAGLRQGDYEKVQELSGRFPNSGRIGELLGGLFAVEAQQAFDDGNYVQALSLLERRSRVQTLTRDQRLLRAWSLYHLGEMEQAREAFESLYRERADEPSRQGLLYTMQRQESYDDLATLLDRAPAADPTSGTGDDYADMAHAIAWAFFESKDFVEAAEWFQRALGQRPGFEDAAWGLALSRMEMGDGEGALQAAALLGDSPRARTLRAQITYIRAQAAYDRGNYEEALRWLDSGPDPSQMDRALALDSVRLRAWSYYQLERYSEAGATFERLYRNERSEVALRGMFLSLAQQERWSDLVPLIEPLAMAIERRWPALPEGVSASDEAGVISVLAWTLYREGNPDAAWVWFRRGLELDPDSGDFAHGLALASFDRGDLATAEQMARRWPDHPRMRELLALTLRSQAQAAYNQEDYLRSLRLLEESRHYQALDSASTVLMGWCLYQLGEYERAADLLRPLYERGVTFDRGVTWGTPGAQRAQPPPVSYRRVPEMESWDLPSEPAPETPPLRDWPPPRPRSGSYGADDEATLVRAAYRGPRARVVRVAYPSSSHRGDADSAETAIIATDLGWALLEQGDLERAAQWFERALEHDPASQRAATGLIRTRLLQGDTRAIEDLARRFPDNPEIRQAGGSDLVHRAEKCYQAGRYGEALDYLDRYARTHTLEPRLREMRAMCLYRLERYDEAAREFESLYERRGAGVTVPALPRELPSAPPKVSRSTLPPLDLPMTPPPVTRAPVTRAPVPRTTRPYDLPSTPPPTSRSTLPPLDLPMTPPPVTRDPVPRTTRPYDLPSTPPPVRQTARPYDLPSTPPPVPRTTTPPPVYLPPPTELPPLPEELIAPRAAEPWEPRRSYLVEPPPEPPSSAAPSGQTWADRPREEPLRAPAASRRPLGEREEPLARRGARSRSVHPAEFTRPPEVFELPVPTAAEEARRSLLYAPPPELAERLAFPPLSLPPEGAAPSRERLNAALILGWSTYQQGHWGEAASWFWRALQIDPTSQEAARGLGLAHIEQGNLSQAEQIARRYAGYPPMRELLAETLVRQADVLFAEEDYPGSLARFEEAASYVSLDRPRWLQMGWAAYHTGRHDRASEIFESLYLADPDAAAAEGLFFAMKEGGDVQDLARFARQSPGPYSGWLEEQVATVQVQRKMFLAAEDTAPVFRELRNIDGPVVSVGAAGHDKTGESGLGQLRLFRLPFAQAEFHWGGVWKAGVRLDRVDLDAGNIRANALMGSPPRRPRPFTFRPVTDIDAGIEPHFFLRREGWISPYLELGTTPLDGVVDARVVGRLGFQHSLTRTNWGVELYARPIRESILSYVGLVDPYTGAEWGRAVRQGASASVYHQWSPRWGTFLRLGGESIKGERVKPNERVYGALSASYSMRPRGLEFLSVGPYLLYEEYDENLERFTFGHGGYFSPQEMFEGGAAVDVATPEGRRFWLGSRVHLGYNTQEKDAAPFFPFLSDPRFYPAEDVTGAVFGVDLKGVWQLNEHFALGTGLLYNDSPRYNHGAALLYLSWFPRPRASVFSTDYLRSVVDFP